MTTEGDGPERVILRTMLPHSIKKKLDEQPSTSGRAIKRTSSEVQDFINANTDHGLVSTANEDTISMDLPVVDGQRVDRTMLRPCGPTDTDDRGQTDDSDTYIIVHRQKLCSMWNAVFKDHLLYKMNCAGDLIWDEEKSKKWGLVWKAALKCDTCAYKSNQYKLYVEAESDTCGPKTAAIHLGMQVGLMKQGMSNTGMK